MKREELTEKILDLKRQEGWTWKRITDEIGGMSEVLVVGALLGQMRLTEPQSERAAKLFQLTENERRLLNEVPMRGAAMPPTDPLLYRFYELVMVNGPAWKALIEEEFGDGIMSAIDFDMTIERQPDPNGDRVKLSMTGKFLPFKYYGASGNEQATGRKETLDDTGFGRFADTGVRLEAGQRLAQALQSRAKMKFCTDMLPITT